MDSFFGCYLLRSESRKAASYIGFTVNPRRRLRQHNGEIGAGANRTKRCRPWAMVLIIHGFPNKICALQFEWAWQNPSLCRLTKEKVQTLPFCRYIFSFASKLLNLRKKVSGAL